MNIAVYAPILFEQHRSVLKNFIVQTFFELIRQQPHHKFYLVTSVKYTKQIELPLNTQIIFLNATVKNSLLKGLWWDVKLSRTLKKIKADFLISFDQYCSLSALLPQFVVFPDIQKVKSSYLKKGKLCIVKSMNEKKMLIEKYGLPEEKITLVYPFAGKEYREMSFAEKELVKNKYSEGKEFFLYDSSFPSNESFIELLKAFSHFKKRQQSNFKLLLLTKSNSFFEKQLATYKYRGDIKFIAVNEIGLSENINAAAYVVVLPFNSVGDIIASLNAMQSGVPVITTKNSAEREVAGDAVLYTETQTIKEIGEKMIQLYTNETLRSALTEKGKIVVKTFSNEKTSELLWQSFMKALQ